MDDKKKTNDEASEERFRERLTWNMGDLDILHIPGKTPEEVEQIRSMPHRTGQRHRVSKTPQRFPASR